MAGGGIKPGITYGRTDDYGYNIADADGQPVLSPTPAKNGLPAQCTSTTSTQQSCTSWASITDKRLTYRYQGRDFRLTDVHGHVVHDILA